MGSLKSLAREHLPQPLWALLRRTRAYLRRIGHWVLVIAEIRGDGMGEAAKLYLSALAAPVTALAQLEAWRDPQLLWDVRVRDRDGGRFLCRRGSDDLWHVLPSGQGAVRGAIARNLSAGGAFVDAGANIGAFTVFGARLVGENGHVVAVEMVPETARRLRDHLRMNGLGWVKVVEGALSDRADQELVAMAPTKLAGQASIVAVRPGIETSEIRVRTTTLDLALSGLERIDLLKIDIEGAEPLAMAGGCETLARTRCLIFEDHGESTAGKRAAEIVAKAGFRLERLDGNNLIGFR